MSRKLQTPMFSPPDDESTKNKTSSNTLKKRKFKSKKKKKKKVIINQSLKLEFKKKDPRLASAMSSWAQSFTTAATWQMKHQLAFWKARAKALEYENRLLHDIIKNQHYTNPNINYKQELYGKDASQVEDAEENEEDEENIELDENYIQFITATTMFREERDKQRLEAKEKAEKQSETKKVEMPEHNPENLKQFYGDRWQKISTLEMSIQSKYMNELDKEKPKFWPNIPFNFDFSV